MLKTPPPYAIASVDHALRLIFLLQTESPLRVADAAARLGVAPSTAHRLLAMLVYRDFAVQSDDRRYHPGPALTFGSHPGRHDMGGVTRLRETFQAHLEILAERIEESVGLMLRRGTSAYFVAFVEGPQAVRVGDREGMTFPAYKASGGKALLAELADDDVRHLYDPGRRPSHEPGPDLTALLRELAAIRVSRVAINREGTEPGVAAVARTVRDGTGQAVGAISISMPAQRFDEGMLRRTKRALGWACDDVEQSLAQPGGAPAAGHSPGEGAAADSR